MLKPKRDFDDGLIAEQIKWEFCGTIKNKMVASLEGPEAEDI